MLLNARSTAARRLGVMTFSATMAAATAGLGAGIAQAAPGDDITEQCLETSLDAGATWTALSDFAPTPGNGYTDYTPSPGDEGPALVFDVRNTCDTPAKLVIFSENWTVSDGATATVRGAIDGVQGQQVEIGPGKDAAERIVLQEKNLDKNAKTGVEYLIGIPAGEEAQGFNIKPGWGFALVELEEDQAAPSAPTGLQAGSVEVETGTPVTITGTAEPGSEVTVAGGGQSCTTTAAGDGSFSCALTFPTAGQQEITATATNGNGTSAPSELITVTVTDEDGGGTDSGSGSLGSLTGSADFGSLDVFGSLGLK